MAVLNLDANATYGENGVGKLYMATNYEGQVFEQGSGTNETQAVQTLAALTYVDIGYFEKFETTIKNGDTKTIETDYCGAGEISTKSEQIYGFKVDVQEILEMNNLAQIIGAKVKKESGGEEIILSKRQFTTRPHLCFKFVTCPKNGKYNVFYFTKARLSGDITIPFNNLAREDFSGVTLEFEVAKGGNYLVQKGVSS